MNIKELKELLTKCIVRKHHFVDVEEQDGFYLFFDKRRMNGKVLMGLLDIIYDKEDFNAEVIVNENRLGIYVEKKE